MGLVHYKLRRSLKTVPMSADTSKSAQVVKDYMRHKLAISALRHIHELIREFEKGRALDLRLAQFGSIIILALIAGSFWFLLGVDRMTLF